MMRSSALRILRDRIALFFLLVLPVAVILIVGATVSGFGEFDVGVLDEGAGPLGADLATALDEAPALDVTYLASRDDATTVLRREVVSAVVVLPSGMDTALRQGNTVQIRVLADQASTGQVAAVTAVAGVVADHAATVQAAQFATAEAGGGFDVKLALAERLASSVPALGVELDMVDAESDFLPEGFSYSAPTMLVLFVFINAIAAGSAIIATRELGIYERMLAGPVTTRAIVAGEVAVYGTLSLFQAGLIVGIGAVLFGVDWGDPLAATVLVVLWALVGTGAGVLSGSLFRTADQATSIGPPVGIALAMLGGCMWPLEIVPRAMQVIGHAVPHAWAVDAWTTLLSRGGSLADIGTELLVLVAFATALMGIAVGRLRHRLVA